MGITLSLDASNCECGDHSTAIITYNTDNDDCCNGGAGAYGYYTTYTSSGGAWKVKDRQLMTGNEAQKLCCPNP